MFPQMMVYPLHLPLHGMLDQVFFSPLALVISTMPCRRLKHDRKPFFFDVSQPAHQIRDPR